MHPITIDPAIRGGQPCVSDTRVPASTICWYVWNGYSDREIIRLFPQITPNSIISACWFYAQNGPLLWKHRWRKWLKETNRQINDDRYDLIRYPPNSYERLGGPIDQILQFATSSAVFSKNLKQSRSHPPLYVLYKPFWQKQPSRLSRENRLFWLYVIKQDLIESFKERLY